MRVLFFFSIILLLTTSSTPKKPRVKSITTKEFKELIWNYTKDKEWRYKGDKPVIVDFYADWCPPCHRLSPILTKIQKEYGDSLQIYKVNIEKEKDLAKLLEIKNIPLMLFIPKNENPVKVLGVHSKNDLEKMILKVLKVNKVSLHRKK